MKKIYSAIFISFALLLSGVSLKAQVQHLCGNDTLILHLNNYQYGQIQWEQSEDSVAWKVIDGAIDTVYKFYPDGNKYYRAGITLALCPIIYSGIFKVSVGVTARAGMDIRTSIPNIALSANKPVGCTGIWSIFSGTSGSFDDSTNPLTKFTGQIGQVYKLVWSLTNICGTTTDTMNVEMIQNIYRNNIVYVDTTDIILSNSTQQAQGNYIIKFSSPVPTVTDSTVLIFLTQDKFLLKVQSVTTNADTAFINTNQGSLQDFITNGVIDFSPFDYKVDTLSKGVMNRLPTRLEILNHNYSNGQIIYFKQNTSESFAKINESKNSKSFYDNNTLSLTINPIEVYSDNNMTLTISGNINFTPNLIAYLDVWMWHLDTMIIKFDDAILDYTLVPELQITGTCNVVNFDKEWLLYHQDVLVDIAGVPVWISADVYIKALFTINVNGTVDVKLTYNYNREYNAGIYYGQHDKQFTTFSSSTEPLRTITPQITGQASLESNFKMGPKFSLKLYNTLTGYIEFYAFKYNLKACINNQLDWNASIDLSSELVLGGYGKLLGWEFWSDSKSIPFGWFNDKFPYIINKESGNMQSGTAGQVLTYPVKVRVQSDWYIPMPYVNVYFEPVNGSVQNTAVTTDANGYAQTNWTPDNTVGTQYLNAYVQDCNSDVINSKICFTSYINAGTTDCEQSTLDMALDVNTTNNTIKPIATRGVLPYQYSTNGTTYQTTKPVLTLTNGTTYKFYVKDANGCIISKSFTYNINLCTNTDITLNIAIDNGVRKIDVTPQGGTAPYLYAYVTPSNYTTVSTHTFNAAGVYTVYVKDANGCDSTITIQDIADPAAPYNCPSTVTDADGNVYNTVQIGTQCWMASNLNVGTMINGTTDQTNNSTIEKYCYNNDVNNCNIYGGLYQWAETVQYLNGATNTTSWNPVPTGSVQGICPNGWHVPSDVEWTTLTTYLGGESVAGGKLKEAGYTHWLSPNTGANNSSGFTALPSGFRSYGVTFGGIGYFGYLWSSTEFNTISAEYRSMYLDDDGVGRSDGGKDDGHSVRCIKDLTTTSSIPTITTNPITNIAQTTATSGGNVTNDGGVAVTAKGVCWSTNQSPTITDSHTTDGTGTGNFTSSIAGLTTGTFYNVRAYATNSIGTAYGNQLSFIAGSLNQPCPGTPTVTDADGNVYGTVQIGTQCWMIENLKVTHYSNGDAIPNVTDATWGSLTTGAYCWYNNDAATYSNTYGALYNWYTVSDSRNIAPTGWHVPTHYEWRTLERAVCTSSTCSTDFPYDNTTQGLRGINEGGKLKETGYIHWTNPNTGATNSSGFTALPGGVHSYNGVSSNIGDYGYWWSSTAYDATNAWDWNVLYNSSQVDSYANWGKGYGLSVRCVKD